MFDFFLLGVLFLLSFVLTWPVPAPQLGYTSVSAVYAVSCSHMLTVLTLLVLASACLAAPPGEEQETLAGHRVLRWLPRDTAHHARLARQAETAGCSAWKEGGPGRPAGRIVLRN